MLARLVQCNRQAPLAQIPEKVNAGSHRNTSVSGHTVHCGMGLPSHRPVRVTMLTLVHCQGLELDHKEDQDALWEGGTLAEAV